MTQQLRAEVCKLEGTWWVFAPAEHPTTWLPIAIRAAGKEHPDSPFATHAEALEAALAWVGLTRQRVHLDDAGLRALAEIGLTTPPEHKELS